ncbi:MAG TPA: hypothetical protein PKC30_04570 [Saprospiraceae bacterium]|nr:hypothetical protein [Saprospiraceae bacterium]
MKAVLKLKILLPFLLIIVVIMAFIAYSMYHKKHVDMLKAKPNYLLTASELYSAFEKDEEEANATYLGKIVQVKGRVSSVLKDEKMGNIYLSTNGNLGEISCSFLDYDFMTGIEEGMEVTVRGICTGILMDVILERCTLINKN